VPTDVMVSFFAETLWFTVSVSSSTRRQ